MIKSSLLSILFVVLLITGSFSAGSSSSGSSGGDGASMKSNYEKAVSYIKKAKKILNWHPKIKLNDGLKSTIKSFK